MSDPGYGGEHRIVISRDGAMDTLAVQVEHVPALNGAGLDGFGTRISLRLRTVLGIGATVVPVPQFTFDRTEFKARRVIDDRTLLRRIAATESGNERTPR
jgi:phenylacetate-CoA ligase